MQQSRIMSFIESSANVAVGYVLAVMTQIIVFPYFGFRPSLGENLTIGLAFVGVSLVRGYLLRRLFEAIGRRRRHRTIGFLLPGQASRGDSEAEWKS